MTGRGVGPVTLSFPRETDWIPFVPVEQRQRLQTDKQGSRAGSAGPPPRSHSVTAEEIESAWKWSGWKEKHSLKASLFTAVLGKDDEGSGKLDWTIDFYLFFLVCLQHFPKYNLI